MLVFSIYIRDRASRHCRHEQMLVIRAELNIVRISEEYRYRLLQQRAITYFYAFGISIFFRIFQAELYIVEQLTILTQGNSGAGTHYPILATVSLHYMHLRHAFFIGSGIGNHFFISTVQWKHGSAEAFEFAAVQVHFA